MGIVQGLTEFLPVSSSGHLMISRELLGVQAEGFMDFTVTVHFATVLSTIVVFWAVIWNLLKGVLKFKYNDETDYFFKLIVSIIPVGIVGLLFKDQVESLFGESLNTVAICLIVTALLLSLSDFLAKHRKPSTKQYRNGISYWQSAIVGLSQAVAVAPGLSRSGTTIATGLITGVKRDKMAQFSFLMVLAPIIGEQVLDIVKSIGGAPAGTTPFVVLLCGFIGAFVSGLFACKVMIAIVKKAKLSYFSIYCLILAGLIFLFG